MRKDAGESYVVYGSAALRGQTIDMRQPPQSATIIFGGRDGAIVADVLVAGDIHGDGYDDLFIGVPGDAGLLRRRYAGGIAVVAGGPNLPNAIDLKAPEVPVVWISGPDAYHFLAYCTGALAATRTGMAGSMSCPSGMAGDGPQNNRNNPGEAHVISGYYLAQYLEGAVTVFEMAGGTAFLTSMELALSYPNPFNAVTQIRYALPAGAARSVRLEIYSVGGQLI